MADLLRSHPSVAMGRERYALRFKRLGEFGPELFEQDRFCTRLEADDTHHRSLQPYYADLLSRFRDCTHIGDKVPKIYENYALINRHFPDCKIIFMVRNVLDVAQSFELRAMKNARMEQPVPRDIWQPTRDYSQAVVEWNESLQQTLRVLSRLDVMVVEYEQLYVEPVLLQRLFQFLNLDTVASVRAFWDRARHQRDKLESERAITLGSNEKRHIARYADFRSYRELLRWSEEHS